MTLKKARRLRNGLMLAGIAVMLLSYVFELLFWIGVLVTFSCLIPHFLYNKCPHCGKQLGRNEGPYCRHCGHSLGG